MVDNINLNQIKPLISSTEKVKAVDRKPRNNSQQPPFKGAQQDKQKKKKKKKKKGQDDNQSKVLSSRDGPRFNELSVRHNPEKKTDSKLGQPNKIIDIRV